jgi:hypothetical protein
MLTVLGTTDMNKISVLLLLINSNADCGCKMQSHGMLRCVALVRTDVSEERIASIIMAKRIGELGTTLAVTSNRSTLRRLEGKVGVTGSGVGLFNSQTAKGESISSEKGEVLFTVRSRG